MYQFQIACHPARLLPSLEFSSPYCDPFPSSTDTFFNRKSLLFRKFSSIWKSTSVCCSLIEIWCQIHVSCLKSAGLCPFAIILAHRYLLKSRRKTIFYPLCFPFCNSGFILYKSTTYDGLLYQMVYKRYIQNQIALYFCSCKSLCYLWLHDTS